VPLLAFVNSWQMAAFLIILERFGKSIRVPARDAMLSYATKHTGRGWGFGVHEALDQIGAIVGPLAMALILFYKQSYRLGFATLLIPALLALAVLVITRLTFPRPQEMEREPLAIKAKGLSKTYWLYLLAVGLVGAGYADFALIAYHFQKASVISPSWIPLFYAIAMGVDGLAALLMGRLFDRKGISVLAVATAIAALFAPLVFLGGFYAALAGMVLWGIGMGSQETLMRSVVAHLTPPTKRGSAYGVLNLVFGAFWAAGSAAIGLFYDISLIYVVIFSLAAQLAAVPLFLRIKIRP
jgi:MFS family permease